MSCTCLPQDSRRSSHPSGGRSYIASCCIPHDPKSIEKVDEWLNSDVRVLLHSLLHCAGHLHNWVDGEPPCLSWPLHCHRVWATIMSMLTWPRSRIQWFLQGMYASWHCMSDSPAGGNAYTLEFHPQLSLNWFSCISSEGWARSGLFLRAPVRPPPSSGKLKTCFAPYWLSFFFWKSHYLTVLSSRCLHNTTVS